MVIMAKNEMNIVNSEHIENIHIGGDEKSIKANMASQRGCELARYDNKIQAKFALGMLFAALQADDRCFQFPQDIDIDFARQHEAHMTSRKRSHGGS